MSIKQGDYLKKLRADNGLSQEKLAEKLGVSRQSISKWEQDYAVPDTDNMLKLSKLYGISVDTILNCGVNAEEISDESETESSSASQYADAGEKQPNSENAVKEKKKHGWFFAAYPCIAVLVTVLLGVLNSSLWKTSWIFLLTIPLFYTGIIAREKKNLLIFCYPAAVLIIYLLGGFYLSLWHPLWVIFLTIPIYYIWAAFARKNKKHNQ